MAGQGDSQGDRRAAEAAWKNAAGAMILFHLLKFLMVMVCLGAALRDARLRAAHLAGKGARRAGAQSGLT
jgi:hypothetical protein